jgi:hypothetical protein
MSFSESSTTIPRSVLGEVDQEIQNLSDPRLEFDPDLVVLALAEWDKNPYLHIARLQIENGDTGRVRFAT